MISKVLIFSIIVLLFALFRFLLMKHLDLDTSKSVYKHKTKTHLLIEIILTILLLGTLYIWFVVLLHPFEFYYFIGGLSGLFAIRSLLEWWFDKKSKSFLLSVIDCIFCLILLFYFIKLK